MKNSEKVYNFILKIDSNVEPAILTFGSLLFDFLCKDDYFNISKFNHIAEEYHLYSAENLCRTYEWLKNNNLIYYSKSENKYFATNLVLNLKLKIIKCRKKYI